MRHGLFAGLVAQNVQPSFFLVPSSELKNDGPKLLEETKGVNTFELVLSKSAEQDGERTERTTWSSTAAWLPTPRREALWGLIKLVAMGLGTTMPHCRGRESPKKRERVYALQTRVSGAQRKGVPVPLNMFVSVCDFVSVGGRCCCCASLCGGGALWWPCWCRVSSE